MSIIRLADGATGRFVIEDRTQFDGPASFVVVNPAIGGPVRVASYQAASALFDIEPPAGLAPYAETVAGIKRLGEAWDGKGICETRGPADQAAEMGSLGAFAADAGSLTNQGRDTHGDSARASSEAPWTPDGMVQSARDTVLAFQPILEMLAKVVRLYEAVEGEGLSKDADKLVVEVAILTEEIESYDRTKP